MVLFGILTLAVWPEVVRQVELLLAFPRPVRVDYILLLWAAVPWIWAHPRWFEWRTWPEQFRENRDIVVGAIRKWWTSPRRVANAWDAGLRHGRHFLGLDQDDEPAAAEQESTPPPSPE